MTRNESGSHALHCPGRELGARASPLDHETVARRRHRQRQRNVDRPLFAERATGRTGEACGLRAGVRLEAHDLDGEVVALADREERVGRVERRPADAAGQVGHAEPRHHPSVGERVRRKGHRHAHDGRRTRAGFGPEHGTAAVVPDPRARLRDPGAHRAVRPDAGGDAEQREHERRDAASLREQNDRGQQEDRRRRRGRRGRVSAPEEERRRGLLRDRERRDAVGRIALQEVEDLRPARVEPGRERRPRDRRLGRDGRGQRRVPSARLQLREIREAAVRQHLLDDGGIDAVEPEDHDAAGRGAAGAPRRPTRERCGNEEPRREQRDGADLKRFGAAGVRRETPSDRASRECSASPGGRRLGQPRPQGNLRALRARRIASGPDSRRGVVRAPPPRRPGVRPLARPARTGEARSATAAAATTRSRGTRRIPSRPCPRR